MTRQAFAIWITGLPASGKSTITSVLVDKLKKRGISPLVLESDQMRRILTPEATYRDEERDRFYMQLAGIGEIAVRSGIPVIFDATANRRKYRDRARSAIRTFIEVYVNSPLDICMSRDPKGIYASARAGSSATVPGVQAPYEPPEAPELMLVGTRLPEFNADRILEFLQERGYV